MRIYTRGGDTGTTGLYGGQRVAKNACRVEALGTVDELNTLIGWAFVVWSDVPGPWRIIQTTLFDIGAELATPGDASINARVTDDHVVHLERLIDETETELESLQTFILPGGSELAARLHVARAVARRAERAVVAASDEETVRPVLIRYLNRLSDALFVAARRANKYAAVADVPYVATRMSDDE